ncbi:molecular chaperone [uncultured Adlercreutzia sp.]|uniref:TorD/DmsD family molecular chaperone n=1 Tax=uncultured Adlercreutzia sp. TaxID=875803 RepID=UPI0026F39C42|nr:molecular chaperone TorD family protein [uncultured Adlercreutzia sp.]
MNQEAIEGYDGLLRGHSAFLGMLARLYYRPLSQDELDAIAAMEVADFAFDDARVGEGLAEAIAYLRRGGSTLRQDVNVDYTSAFYGINSYEGATANPCESVFLGEDGLIMQAETRAVFNVYKSECIRKDPKLGVPDDHLSFELQFLAMMGERAAAALEEGDVPEALRNAGVQQAFLQEHILAWFPKLKAVALHLVKTPFYPGVLTATEGYLTCLLADLREMQTSPELLERAA